MPQLMLLRKGRGITSTFMLNMKQIQDIMRMVSLVMQIMSKHDYWCGQMDGAMFVRLLYPIPQTREHILELDKWAFLLLLFLNKADMVDDKSYWSWLKWK